MKRLSYRVVLVIQTDIRSEIRYSTRARLALIYESYSDWNLRTAKLPVSRDPKRHCTARKTSIAYYPKLGRRYSTKLGVAPVAERIKNQACVGDVKEYDPYSQKPRSESRPASLDATLVAIPVAYHLQKPGFPVRLFLQLKIRDTNLLNQFHITYITSFAINQVKYCTLSHYFRWWQGLPCFLRNEEVPGPIVIITFAILETLEPVGGSQTICSWA